MQKKTEVKKDATNSNTNEMKSLSPTMGSRKTYGTVPTIYEEITKDKITTEKKEDPTALDKVKNFFSGFGKYKSMQ